VGEKRGERLFPFAEVLPLILDSFLQAFLSLQFLPLFLIVMLIIAMQYRRMEKMRESFYGQGAGRTGTDNIINGFKHKRFYAIRSVLHGSLGIAPGGLGFPET
jgi:hypothetical protein